MLRASAARWRSARRRRSPMRPAASSRRPAPTVTPSVAPRSRDDLGSCTSIPPRPGEVDERGVELGARHDPRVVAVVGQREDALATARGHQDRLSDRRVGGERRTSRPSRRGRSAPGGEAVAAGLVARERRLVDHEDVDPERLRLHCRRDPGRPCADDEQLDVDLGHPNGATVLPPVERLPSGGAVFAPTHPERQESTFSRSVAGPSTVQEPEPTS